MPTELQIPNRGLSLSDLSPLADTSYIGVSCAADTKLQPQAVVFAPTPAVTFLVAFPDSFLPPLM